MASYIVKDGKKTLVHEPKNHPDGNKARPHVEPNKTTRAVKKITPKNEDAQ